MSFDSPPVVDHAEAPRASSREHHVPGTVVIDDVRVGEDIEAYLERTRGGFDRQRALEILGAANAFKEGDATIGVAAADESSRVAARLLLARTRLSFFAGYPLLEDTVSAFIAETTDHPLAAAQADWTVGELKRFLRLENEASIQAAIPGLASDAIAAVVKLCSDTELA
ncbi:MAG: ethanolamine ammonia-lyase subunit EutB, partial [Myxococcota bacterium]